VVYEDRQESPKFKGLTKLGKFELYFIIILPVAGAYF
jgi:hypothetical protein